MLPLLVINLVPNGDNGLYPPIAGNKYFDDLHYDIPLGSCFVLQARLFIKWENSWNNVGGKLQQQREYFARDGVYLRRKSAPISS